MHTSLTTPLHYPLHSHSTCQRSTCCTLRPSECATAAAYPSCRSWTIDGGHEFYTREAVWGRGLTAVNSTPSLTYPTVHPFAPCQASFDGAAVAQIVVDTRVSLKHDFGMLSWLSGWVQVLQAVDDSDDAQCGHGAFLPWSITHHTLCYEIANILYILHIIITLFVYSIFSQCQHSVFWHSVYHTPLPMCFNQSNDCLENPYVCYHTCSSSSHVYILLGCIHILVCVPWGDQGENNFLTTESSQECICWKLDDQNPLQIPISKIFDDTSWMVLKYDLVLMLS